MNKEKPFGLYTTKTKKKGFVSKINSNAFFEDKTPEVN